jgi:hypothetical protein
VKYYISSEAPEIDGCIETRTMEKKAKEKSWSRAKGEETMSDGRNIFCNSPTLQSKSWGRLSFILFALLPTLQILTTFLTVRFFVSNFPCLETLGMATQ